MACTDVVSLSLHCFIIVVLKVVLHVCCVLKMLCSTRGMQPHVWAHIWFVFSDFLFYYRLSVGSIVLILLVVN